MVPTAPAVGRPSQTRRPLPTVRLFELGAKKSNSGFFPKVRRPMRDRTVWAFQVNLDLRFDLRSFCPFAANEKSEKGVLSGDDSPFMTGPFYLGLFYGSRTVIFPGTHKVHQKIEIHWRNRSQWKAERGRWIARRTNIWRISEASGAILLRTTYTFTLKST